MGRPLSGDSRVIGGTIGISVSQAIISSVGSSLEQCGMWDSQIDSVATDFASKVGGYPWNRWRHFPRRSRSGRFTSEGHSGEQIWLA